MRRPRLEAADVDRRNKNTLFRCIDTHCTLTARPQDLNDALWTIEGWAEAIGLLGEFGATKCPPTRCGSPANWKAGSRQRATQPLRRRQASKNLLSTGRAARV